MKIPKNSLVLLFHFLFWLIWILIFNEMLVFRVLSIPLPPDYLINPEAYDLSNYSKTHGLPFILIATLVKATMSYFIIFVLYPNTLKRSRLTLLLLIPLCAILFFYLENFILLSYVGQNKNYGAIHLSLWKNASIFQYIGIIAMVIGYLFLREWHRIETKMLNYNNIHLKSELSFLRYQVNPHLLFNTLNNLFSMAQESKADNLAQGIAKLSGLLRYTLYESNIERLPINQEIQFIQRYIDIQKLRVSEADDFKVELKQDGDFSTINIAPLMLIPFIENAFKHGLDINKPSWVKIHLAIKEQYLIYQVENSIHRSHKSLSREEGGIGLENLKKRLELNYPNDYLLETFEKAGKFIAALEIKIR